MGVIATKDGYLNLGVGAEGQWKSLCAALERPDLQNHPDFATMQDRYRNRPACWAALEPIFAERTTLEWLDLLETHGVPAGPIYDPGEMFDDPQVVHTGIVETVTHPARGETRLIGQPVTLSRTPASLDTAAPDVGADTDEVLLEFGFNTEEITQFRSSGAV